MEEDLQSEAGPKVAAPKSKKMMIIIIAAVALLAVVGAGIAVVINHEEDAAKEAAAMQKKPLPTLYFSIAPPFIVNFQTLGRMRYMQISVDVMTHDPRVIDVLQDNLPLVKNNLLSLFDAQDFDVMSTMQGRQALREAALEEVQKIVQSKLGVHGVEAVLFTSFIIQ